MARTPRRDFNQGTNGSSNRWSGAPPRQEPDPGEWRSGEEGEGEFEDDEDEELDEAEHEILLDEDFGDLSDTQDEEDL